MRQNSPVTFSNQFKYLLLDSHIIGRAENVRLVLGKVEKDSNNPLFIEDKPWEVRFDNLYANVIFDDEEQVYKVWYNPFIIDEVTSNTPPVERKCTPYKPKKREMGVCYAISNDGIVWEKPELGIIDFNGSKKNNLVMRRVHGVGIKKDMRDSNLQQRYKAFMQGGVATSPDGLHWSDFIACPEVNARGDTHNNSFWDNLPGKYIGITRLWDGQRIVGRTESIDFLKWTEAVEILRALPEELHRQTYAMPVFRYANVYLGLLMMFDTRDDVVDCELAWSADTVHWERVCPGTPLIPRGEKGSFDSGCIYGAAYPILRNNELLLYYGGSDGPHTGWRAGGFGLARLRLDGFAGMEPMKATETARKTKSSVSEANRKPKASVNEENIIVTKPIECTGKQLLVNVDSAGGSLRAAVLDADGLGLDECQPIVADLTDGIVTWRGSQDLTGLKGKKIRLLFELKSAKLYAFGFSETKRLD